MGWFDKIRHSFKTAGDKIKQSISDLVYKKALDAASLSKLEQSLIEADMGVVSVKKLMDQIKKLSVTNLTQEGIMHVMHSSFEHVVNSKLLFASGVNVLVFMGVNGNGKTTSIAKVANYYLKSDKKVLLAACDTFRAAATEQLAHWADVLRVPIIKADKTPGDPASVAYKAIQTAQEESFDLVLVDTSGRLNNNKNLMDELTKMRRVMLKLVPEENLHFILVMDATTGRSSEKQVEDFQGAISQVSGLIVTKMDGTAKAGSIFNILDKFKLPIYFIGTGEKIEDLEVFSPDKFVSKLLE